VFLGSAAALAGAEIVAPLIEPACMNDPAAGRRSDREGPEAVLRLDLNERVQMGPRRDDFARACHGSPDSASAAIVLIPSLPEVYDDVWNDSFGNRPIAIATQAAHYIDKHPRAGGDRVIARTFAEWMDAAEGVSH
jgi:hypothetical protein